MGVIFNYCNLLNLFLIYPLPFSCWWRLCHNYCISVIRNLIGPKKKEEVNWFGLKDTTHTFFFSLQSSCHSYCLNRVFYFMIRLLLSGAGLSLVCALVRDKFVSWISTSVSDLLSSVRACVRACKYVWKQNYKQTPSLLNTLHKSFDRCMNKTITSSWMYWIRKGDARRLSTGKVKKPWISFWCKSMVMMCVNPVK